MRLAEPDGDLIGPSTFLYIAEQLDLVQEIDRWVVSRALEAYASRPNAPVLEINLSARSIGDPDLVALIERLLRRGAIDPSRLVFEVTETSAIANLQEARSFASRLGQLGCRFALDDFGSGFGSFYYLKHLPYDYLKIDGEFVRSCLTSRTDQLVIQSVVGIARGLGKATVAEFIEDADTAAFVAEQGVDYLQGHWVGMPGPADEVIVD